LKGKQEIDQNKMGKENPLTFCTEGFSDIVKRRYFLKVVEIHFN